MAKKHAKLHSIQRVNLTNKMFHGLKNGNLFLNENSCCWKPLETSGCGGLSGRGLNSRPRGHGFQPHRGHCVMVLEQDTFILA